MENAPDFGVGWRARIEKWLTEEGWTVHNPCTKETTIFKRRNVKGSTFYKLKTLKTLDVYQAIMRDIIDYDLDIIDRSDAILVLWDEYAKGGTIHELGYAREHNIPVIMMSKLPVSKISGWVLGCTTELFFKWSDVKEYLSGGKYHANRTTRRSKKRKRYSGNSPTSKVSGEGNVIRKTTKGRGKKNLRLVG